MDKSLWERWYQALEDENCVEVQMLLNEAGELVKEGWTAYVQSSPERIRKEKIKQSKGRTALHVGARRGDVKLVRHVLGMTGKMSREWKECFLEVKHPDYELDALAMAVINGNMQIVSLLNLAKSLKGYTADAFKVADTNPLKEEDLALQRISTAVLDEISRMQRVERMFHKYNNDGMQEHKRPEKFLEHFKVGIRLKIQTEGGKDLDSDGGHGGTHASEETSAGWKEKEGSVHTFQDRPFDRWFQQNIGYDENFDFNFLDFHLYLFHFTFTGGFEKKLWFAGDFESELDLHCEIQRSISAKAKEVGLLRYLFCELKDGQGRTPLHIAVDYNSEAIRLQSNPIKEFFDVLPRQDDQHHHNANFVNALDGAGRTPLVRAAGIEGDFHFSSALDTLVRDKRINVNATVTYTEDQWGDDLDVNLLSLNNNFKSGALWAKSSMDNYANCSSSAVHLAIIHKHAERVQALLDHGNETRLGDWSCKRELQCIWHSEQATLFDITDVSVLQLAVLVDDARILQSLLKCGADSLADQKLSPFFIAAAMGSPSMIKLFLDSNQGQFDPFITDEEGRSALHFAMERKPLFEPHLLDFVSCQHVRSWRKKNRPMISEDGTDLSKQEEIKEQYGQRKGCIISLLQAGIDIWAEDKRGRTASPGPEAPEDFVTWWYEKVVQETEKVQQNLNAAANAISVTAALVATTSYVGPLQPPLSYGGDPSSAQVRIASVRIFIVCDTLSFYLALAAIMLALLPTLPQPRQSIFKVLRQTRILVALAVTCLFPSIIFILIAFAASSIAVVPDDGLSYHGVSIATAAVGGLICFLVIVWFARGLFNVLKAIGVIQIMDYKAKRALSAVLDGIDKRCRPKCQECCKCLVNFAGKFKRSEETLKKYSSESDISQTVEA